MWDAYTEVGGGALAPGVQKQRMPVDPESKSALVFNTEPSGDSTSTWHVMSNKLDFTFIVILLETDVLPESVVGGSLLGCMCKRVWCGLWQCLRNYIP